MECIQLEWTYFDSYWHNAFFLHGNMAAGIHTCLSLAWVGVFRGQWVKSYRKGEVVLSRLRIGHTYFSHSHILRREDPPECTACQEIYSVRQVLIDYWFRAYTATFYNVSDMKALFDSVNVYRILSFVKEINIFSKI